MSPIVSIFIESFKATGQVLLVGQLEIIRKHNSPEFYSKLLKTGWSFFSLLGTTNNKVLNKICEVFTVPIAQAAEIAGITLVDTE
jgi:hypothetical protein